MEELYHYGILGMKWGKHKAQESSYRQKLAAASKNKSIANTTDAKLFKYRNQSLVARVGKTAATRVAQMLIGDVMTGKISGYSSMSKSEITKKLTSIALTTTANVALNDGLARSASKRYTDSGEKVNPGKKNPLLTKEEAIHMGVATAVKLIPVANIVLGMKMSQANRQRAQNEETFNRWGQNILPEKVDKIVWQSDDLKTAIIDNR